jgi:hypothetical protein
MAPGKIFNVSLHRSGTQSFHNLCQHLGLRSQHWPGFAFDAACAPALTALDRELIWELYQPLVKSSDAFCDLPAPLIFAQAVRDCPDARFLLIRRTVKSWISSVRRHTEGRQLDHMEKLQYWSVCESRRNHVSDYSDEELAEAYVTHERAIAAAMQNLAAPFDVFDLGAPDLGPRIAAFCGYPDQDVSFEDVDINRRFYQVQVKDAKTLSVAAMTATSDKAAMGSIARVIVNENGANFHVSGLNFRFISENYNLHKTNKEEIVILKPPKFLRYYDTMFEKAPTKNVLEFGVFEGGSIILFALAYPDFKFAGVDIRAPNEDVLRHIHDLGLKERVKIYYGVSQTDKDHIAKIIKDQFDDEGIAIISDDASHNYHYSRSTFEFTFAKLARGGFYCLEDWGWAHWGEPFQTTQWVDQPALTNLVFEILMMYASTHGLIDRIELPAPTLACIRRGGARLDEFQIDGLVRMRGRKLMLI